jgi:hypothetical protein
MNFKKPNRLERLETEIRRVMPLHDDQQHPRDLDERFGDAPVIEPVQSQASQMLEQTQITAIDLGRMTGEAIKQSGESVAEALTTLSTALAANVDRLDIVKTEADATLKGILSLIDKCREKAKTNAALVEQAAKVNQEARDMVDAMRKRIDT